MRPASGGAARVRRPADFASALYLGLAHPHDALQPWSALTTGAPAALRERDIDRRVARGLAALVGLPDAGLWRSTLHLFHDLSDALVSPGTTVFADRRLYAVGRWGVEHAARRGARMRWFAHHDADALRRAARASGGGPSLVITDGWCPACGQFAPLAAYADAAPEARIVIDDTQALGIFGRPASGARGATPYGTGGGGTARQLQLAPEARARLVVVASMAKAFGAPLAFVAGAEAVVARFRERGSARVHSSPPSAADVASAARALEINAASGDALRARLWRRVRQFRAGASRLGLGAEGGPFPVQTLHVRAPGAVQAGLERRGIRAALVRSARGPALTFLLSARHSEADIDRALRALAEAVRAPRHATRPLAG